MLNAEMSMQQQEQQGLGIQGVNPINQPTGKASMPAAQPHATS